MAVRPAQWCRTALAGLSSAVGTLLTSLGPECHFASPSPSA
jgi:hypothetical protein